MTPPRSGNRPAAAQTAPTVPAHVAVIMDGNGRWAQARGLRRSDGHREGVNSAREIVRACGELGVEILTLYTFSSENWKRPRLEVDSLMNLLVSTIGEELRNLMENSVKLQVIGRLEELTLPARKAMKYAMKETSGNRGLLLNLALSYGGRREIVDAANALLKAGRHRITEADVAGHLYTAGLRDPDLLIRTSGEMRISNFMLWQLAYTEIVVTDVLWPDFRRPQLLETFAEYGRRQRRFGALAETA